MASNPLLFAVLVAFLISSCSAYSLNLTREQMLAYYQSSIEPKIPAAARMLLGDERINVYVGGKVLGIETARGQLYSFETSPMQDPTIVVAVGDSAVENISAGREGILSAIDSGEIRIAPKNFFSAIKVEAMKRVYAVSGADRRISGAGAAWQAGSGLNSLYVQRTWIED